jgi:hypothetical protein
LNGTGTGAVGNDDVCDVVVVVVDATADDDV